MAVKNHDGDKGLAPITFCGLYLFDERMLVSVPMLPYNRDTYFAPYCNITADAQWALILHFLVCTGPRSSTILDGFLDGLLGCATELEGRGDHPS
jgi:hypothetical protein